MLFNVLTALAFNKKIRLIAYTLNILEILVIYGPFCLYQGSWHGVVFFIGNGFSRLHNMVVHFINMGIFSSELLQPLLGNCTEKPSSLVRLTVVLDRSFLGL